MTATKSSLSLEYVRVQVKTKPASDPTSDTVTMAFTASGAEPIAGDWKAATWETIGSTYFAKCLVGPGGTVNLADGTYDVWVKIVDNPETPILFAGYLKVT